MQTYRKLCLPLLLCLGLAAAGWCHGEKSAGPSEAVKKRLFPGAEAFVTRPLEMDAAIQRRVAARLGRPLEAHDIKSKAYLPMAKGQSLGVLWATDAHLKEGPVDVVVGVDRQGKLVGVALEHSPVAALGQSAYLKQFKGQAIGPRLKQAQPLAANPTASALVVEAIYRGAIVIDEAYFGGKK